jgi:CubicO group peptidase (beta-lactamase class C family)
MSERKRLTALLAALALLAAAPAAGQPVPAAPVEVITSTLDDRIPALMERYEIPGTVVALIRGGETVWTAAYGVADRAEGRPMTTDARCRVESISKSVTAWGVLALAERGRIDLDAPVAGYLAQWRLPESPYDEGAVTPRLLLANTGGMPLGTVGVHYPPDAPRPGLQDRISHDAVLVREPGAAFEYSNAGYNVLEQLVQEVTGRDFGEFMAAEVLRPLGMESASYDWSDDWVPPVPDGHSPDGLPIPVYVYPDRASGGLFATVHDVAAFVEAEMPRYSDTGLAALSRESIRLLHTPHAEIAGLYGLAFDAYGLGHFIERLPSGHTAVAHGGQGSGWMTHFHAVPETGDALVLLTNSQRAWPFFARVLDDWARRAGFGGVGMGVIISAARALRVAIAILLAGTLFWSWRLGRDLLRGRRPEIGTGRGAVRQALQLTAGLVLGAGVAWGVTRDYLFLSAVFPVETPWLGAALAILALALIVAGSTRRARPGGPTGRVGSATEPAASPFLVRW